MSTPPTSPYCTSLNVAYALRQIVAPGAPPADFSSATLPTKEEVDFWIDQKAVSIDMALMEAGYVLPLAVYSTESWPEHQTGLLRLLNVLGAASVVLEALKPAPAMPQHGPQAQSTVYADEFDEALDRIREGRIRFRASCYAGTPASKSLTLRRAPMTSHGEGIIDGMDHLPLVDYTILRSRVDSVWAVWGGATNIESYDWDTMRAWGKR
jgi:hypothetical protein